jgi:hypothetical protein
MAVGRRIDSNNTVIVLIDVVMDCSKEEFQRKRRNLLNGRQSFLLAFSQTAMISERVFPTLAALYLSERQRFATI